MTTNFNTPRMKEVTGSETLANRYLNENTINFRPRYLLPFASLGKYNNEVYEEVDEEVDEDN